MNTAYAGNHHEKHYGDKHYYFFEEESKAGSIKNQQHRASIKTGNNESKTGSIHNLVTGINPSIETEDNIAKEDVNHTAIDIRTPQSLLNSIFDGKRSK